MNHNICGFCGKDSEEVKQLIAGPVCSICDECVEISLDTLLEKGIFSLPRISLRDQFAMAALTGMLSNEELSTIKDIASDAYRYADAMLEARKK